MAPATPVRSWRAVEFGGLDLLHGTFMTHAFARHAHETFSIGLLEHGAMTFACRSGEYTLRLGLIGLINPDEAHDGHAVDVQGWTYRNLYPSAALLVARRVNERVEDASDLSEVDRGALDQGEDGTGEEVDAAGIPVKKGFQGLLELGMLVRRASILSDREAPIVSGGVLDGYPRLMSGTMPCTQGSDARAGDRLTAGFISVEKKEGFSLNYSFDRCKVSTRIARL